MRTEVANMGREILTDLIESSGVDLEALDNVLAEFSAEVKAVNGMSYSSSNSIEG